MWSMLLLLYRLLSWPVTLAAQAAMVIGMGFGMVGLLRLFLAPPMVGLGTVGVGAAIVAVGLVVHVAVQMLEAAIEDRKLDGEPGIL